MEKNYLPLWETFLWYLLYVNYFIYRKTHIFLDQIHCKKLQYFGHLRWRAKSLEKTLMLGKIEGRRRRGNREWDGWMASPTQWTWVWANSGRQWRTWKPGVRQSMGLQRAGHDWMNKEQHRNYAATTSLSCWCCKYLNNPVKSLKRRFSSRF